MPYDWTRYWAPEGDEPDLRSGFLVDPDRASSPFRRSAPDNDSLLPLSEIEVPCAVLLGEPGIGKSTEVEKLCDQLQAQKPTDHHVLKVELGMIVGYSSLQGELLNAPEVQEWKQGEAGLTLILDALDECGMERVERYLENHLLSDSNLADNLTLRITCRSSDWPESLNQSLREFWGLDTLPVYHLAPLREKDVLQAASAHEFNAEAFLEAVQEADAEPFASSPLTLEALLSSYEEKGEIPTRKTILFEEYCRRLSTEENENRRDSGETGILDPEQRVEILSRVAALMIFARRTRFCLEPRASSTADALNEREDVLFGDEIRSQSEDDSSLSRELQTEDIRDAVLHSGLLRGSDEGRTFRWRHRSFAEYLAARFCNRRLEVEQVQPLIEHEYDQAISPHYQSVAAWLGILDVEMADYLLEKDPSLVLSGDPLQYDEARRKKLVAAILEGINQGRLHPRRNDRLNNLSALEHPKLAEQLREWILDEEKTSDAREYALQVARKKNLEDLVADAVDLALDPGTDKYVRIFAMRLVDEAGGSGDREKLRSLAVEPGEEDDDRRIAYEAREILLPDLLSFSGLLDQIRADADWKDPESEERNWYHTLDQWSNSICRRMDRAMLTEALRWAFFSEDASLSLPDFRRSIVRKGIEHAHVEEIATAIATYVTEQVRENHTPGLHVHSRKLDRLRDNKPDTYRSIIREIVDNIAEYSWNDRDLGIVVEGFLHSYGFWRPEDVDWVLEDMQETEDESVEKVYAKIIRSFFDRNGFPDPDGFSRIYQVSRSSQVLRDEIAQWTEPIELESERASELREREQLFQSSGGDPMDPPFEERLFQTLDLCDEDVIEGWVEMCHLLTRSSIERDSDRHEWHREVTDLPAWQALSRTKREEVTEAGHAYLRNADVEQADWLPEDQDEHRVRCNLIFGLMAFWLIAEAGDLTSVTAEVWEKWAPAFFAYVRRTSEKRKETRGLLISGAYRHAPEVCESVIEALLSRFPFKKRELLFILDPISEEDSIQNLLLGLVKKDDFPDSNRLLLTPYLLKWGVTEARPVAEALAEHSDDQELFDGKKVDWLIDVLEADPSFGWKLFRDRFQSEEGWAKRVLRRMSRRRVNLLILPSEVLVIIYSRLCELFPPEEDPPRKFKTHTPSFRDQVRDWRGQLIKGLRNRGTEEAVAALEDLSSRFPENRSWDRTLHRAKRTLREKNASTISPSTLLNLAEDASRRIARTNVELQRLVLESLVRIQNRLDALEQPASTGLWNELSYGRQRDLVRGWLEQIEDRSDELRDEVKEITGIVYTPKEEERLSDYIARQLREDLQDLGFTFTRESEIRSEQNRTDILVKVPPTENGSADLLTVVTEVKGAWNDELFSDLRSQLADRYLDSEDSAYGTQCGIYLVVWFDLDRWSSKDSRRADARRNGPAEDIEDELREYALPTDSKIEPFILSA
jgi:hypothetical protein